MQHSYLPRVFNKPLQNSLLNQINSHTSHRPCIFNQNPNFTPTHHSQPHSSTAPKFAHALISFIHTTHTHTHSTPRLCIPNSAPHSPPLFPAENIQPLLYQHLLFPLFFTQHHGTFYSFLIICTFSFTNNNIIRIHLDWI